MHLKLQRGPDLWSSRGWSVMGFQGSLLLLLSCGVVRFKYLQTHVVLELHPLMAVYRVNHTIK